MDKATSTEIRIQLIRLGFAVGSLVAIIYLQRKLSGPDIFSNAHARWCLTVKRTAQSQADWWQKVANNAATSYQKSRAI
jgi:hypothetical protein